MISVIIPTLNEAEHLSPLLRAVGEESVTAEVIVCDGGSDDDTCAVAKARGARVMTGVRGRGAQLAAGAASAAGDILLFLHGDTVFPAGGLAAIRAALDTAPHVVGGNFRVIFDGNDGFSRWLTARYAWSRRQGFYYGDSGIFLRRSVYEALGGVRPIALMEDYDLVRRLERAGPTCCIAEPPLITSSRRFAGRHPVAIIAGWIAIHGLYWAGVSPERLARLYDSERRRACARKGPCPLPGRSPVG